jgi:hypothetical protein
MTTLGNIETVVSILALIVAIGGFYIFKYPTYFESIYFDSKNNGFHALTSRKHGNPDGDSYIEYYHYYFSLPDGKSFVSNNIQDSPELKGTLKDLKNKTHLNLEPDYNTKIIKLKPNQWEVKNNYSSILITLNNKRFGKSNLVECRSKDKSILFSTHI